MLFDIEDLAEDYQYPILGFEKQRIVWANACARIIFGQHLNNLNSLFSDDEIDTLLHAFESGGNWRGEIISGDSAAAADMIISNGKGYLIIRPNEYKKGVLLDQMLSDAGQMMKDPLNNLYNAIKDLDDPQKSKSAIGVIKHSFYNLVRLSENQIALAGADSPNARMSMTLVPVADFVSDIIASVNETLNDIGITVELKCDLREDRFCLIHQQKLTQIIILLISNAARGLSAGAVLEVNVRFDDRTCFIEVPVSGDAISIYDASSYLTAAGTPTSMTAVENLMMTKMFNAFNSIHDSRIFTNVTKSGQNTIVIAIDTDTRGIVGEPKQVSPGLRPDLIFLSGILNKDSYI